MPTSVRSAARLASKQRRQVLRTSKANPQNLFTARQYSFEAQMDSPPRMLEEGANLQSWRIRARKSRPEAQPLALTLDLVHAQAGRLASIIDQTLSDTSAGGVVLGGDWDASLLPDEAGSGVRARLTSRTLRGGSHAQIAALQWLPTMTNSVSSTLDLKWNVQTLVSSQPLEIKWSVQA